MTPLEAAKELMFDRGYELHWTSGDKTSFGMNKVFGDYEYVIHAEVNVVKNNCKLYFIVPRSVLVIETGYFTLSHPYFKKQFEDQLVSTIHKIIY